MKFLYRLSFIICVAVGFATTSHAEEGNQKERAGKGLLALIPADSITDHTITAGGRSLSYRATAGTLPIFDQTGERKAAIFYTAYAMANSDPARRPVTFVFNGGPGAASTFLHLGLVGPKRAVFGSNGRDGASASLRENSETWLDFTDLVLIDPIGTGWSRTAKAGDADDYWSVRQDAQVLAKVVALYLSRNGRTVSPKYLLGESYGGFRAAKVARALQQGQGIIIAGIVMVSPLLEASFLFGGDRLSLGCALQLPSIAAAELESRKAFSLEALAAVERFALTDYLTTLAGPPPQGKAARSFYERIAKITGLAVELVEKSRGCVRDAYLHHRRDLNSELLSAYDAAFVAPDPYPESDRRRGPDPILDGFVRALGGLFADYARNDLGFKTDMTYVLLANEISGKWDWQASHRGAQPGIGDDLRELLSLNPSFRLLIAHGYADLIIPYAVNRYVLDHLPRPGNPDRVQMRLYAGGHMPYLVEGSRLALTKDAKGFYQAID